MTRRFSGSELVVATHNSGKLAEIRRLLGGEGLTLSSAADRGLPAPEETGTTFLENVTIKALSAARATGVPALADDSGLCVALLSGAPGVYSADWAGPARDFSLAMNKIHDAMLEMARPSDTWETINRRAEFVALVMLAWPDGHVEWAEGRVAGTLVWPPRGAGGHGYDPMFQPMGSDRVFAEMALTEKNTYSHRAQAVEALRRKCFLP